jgi:hypothetical protein
VAIEDHIGLHVRVGISGAGKTHDVKRGVWTAAAEGMPVVVLDRMYEWSQLPAALAPYTTIRHSHDNDGIKKALDDGARIVVVRDDPARHVEPAHVAMAMCDLIKRRSRIENRGPHGIAIPEAHVIAPRHRIDGPVREVATAWRHFRVGAWFDTQRIAALNAAITENARDLKIFATVGELDLARFREIASGARELEMAVREAAARMERGEPGWHVKLGLSRRPPYELTRE